MTEPILDLKDFDFLSFVRRHKLALEGATEEQFAEAIRQALPDFQRNLYVGTHCVVYLPCREADCWRALYRKALEVIVRKDERINALSAKA